MVIDTDECRRFARAALTGLIEADERGVFTVVNEDMADLFGYTRDEMIGMSLTAIMPHRFRAGHASGFAHYVKTRKSIGLLDRRLEVYGLHTSGAEFPISVRVTVQEIGGQLTFRNEIRDISLQRESERGRKFVEPPLFTDLFTILLVESDFAAQEAMIEQLRAHRIANRIVVVNSVDEAEDFAFSRHEYAGRPALPYIVLLSLLLPEINGLEFLRTLRASDETNNVPVVITTVLPRNDEMDELIAMGNCEYIQKPVEFDDVTRVLRSLDLSWMIGRRVS